MLYWLSLRRFNWIDILNMIAFYPALQKHGWAIALLILFLGVVISGIVEVKSGHNYRSGGPKSVR